MEYKDLIDEAWRTILVISEKRGGLEREKYEVVRGIEHGEMEALTEGCKKGNRKLKDKWEWEKTTLQAR